MQYQNFAKLLVEETVGGRWGNAQMTIHFRVADRTISELVGNDEGIMWDELEMTEVGLMTPEEIKFDYDRFCNGKLSIDFNE